MTTMGITITGVAAIRGCAVIPVCRVPANDFSQFGCAQV